MRKPAWWGISIVRFRGRRASSSASDGIGSDGGEAALDGPTSAARNGFSLSAARNPMPRIPAPDLFC